MAMGSCVSTARCASRQTRVLQKSTDGEQDPAAALQVGHAQTAPARTIVEDAAKALGGIDKVRAVKNITLHGYARKLQRQVSRGVPQRT
jgi:phosphoribosylaminoimidazole (AIR) synthetase